MSFLLDVADPSIHFHARQCCHSTGSKSLSSLDTKAASPAVPSSLPSISLPSANSTTVTAAHSSSSSSAKHSLFPHASISSAMTPLTPSPTANMFSTMSHMIRTASSSSSVSLSFSANATPNSSRPSTPEAIHVSDPFTISQTSAGGLMPAANTNTNTVRRPLSPWMMPSVCDDDQMNKLVSFQLS
ncbi:hypothetical protein BC939DRAFT_439087 [Gamsiella multidivaricata]|uniref:uncharacterized protein n=1 Tax=Gamsiella multidivaricata TaxID=101098 RepID=UPI002220E080|nr:uncharacterized protein BC939DRAFT_439087 [Gamsiella multidivaricata]KAI7830358.1 hypothetical protein BC939DRAFT_439087 [Gamsiella multidivaricata]